MKKETADFFASRHLHPYKMIINGNRRNLSSKSVQAAMQLCYEQIEAGKKIHDIDLARFVFATAASGEAAKYESGYSMEDTLADLNSLRSKFEEAKVVSGIWKRRFYITLGGSLVVDIAFILYFLFGVCK